MGWFIGHLIGDFLLQNDAMAFNKKHSSFICVCHCIVYTAAVMLFSGWWKLPSAWIVMIAIFVSHFALDRTKWLYKAMKRHRPRFLKDPYWPWSYIVYDQIIHIVTLWIIARIINAGILS